jgi:hypothetical protein
MVHLMLTLMAVALVLVPGAPAQKLWVPGAAPAFAGFRLPAATPPHPDPGGVSLIDLIERKLVKTIALAGTPDGVAVVR